MSRQPPLAGRPECCWIDRMPETSAIRFDGSKRADVAVVGAGIVGLTAACLLARAGRDVTVLEARRIGHGVTGRSTAKVTSQHTLIYAALIRTQGMERARLYAEANDRGMQKVLALVDECSIECDLERRDAYAYTCRSQRRKALEREALAAQSLGLRANVVDRAPLPFANAGAVCFPNQAQFNAASYLAGLASAVRAAGGRVYEESPVTHIAKARKSGHWRIDLGRGHLEAKAIVIATNLPIESPRPFDTRTRPRCHVAMAFRTPEGAALNGMFIGVDPPSHSLRMGRDRAGELLVVLGPKFPTGHEKNVAGRFRKLEAWVRTNCNVGDTEWRWVNEDYDAPDRVPFAGGLRAGTRRAFIATGFGGWGLSNGTAAAMLIVDQIEGRENPWSLLYDPNRPASTRFNSGGKSSSIVRSLGAIAPGGGGVVARGKWKIAVWKSADGTPHGVSAACTHAGCTVSWNNAALTWDCPCHGSMFSREGEVLHGPATKPLATRRIPASWQR